MSKEIRGFKILIREREEEIKSLRKTLDIVKSKYSTEVERFVPREGSSNNDLTSHTQNVLKANPDA